MQHGTYSTYVKQKCRCDECRAAAAEYMRRWRAKNPEKAKENDRKGSKRWREKYPERAKARSERWRAANPTYQTDLRDTRRTECFTILGGECVRCGATDSLEFDHVNPSTKSFDIGARLTTAWETLMPELMKCQLLCKPCHVAKGDHGRRKTGVA